MGLIQPQIRAGSPSPALSTSKFSKRAVETTNGIGRPPKVRKHEQAQNRYQAFKRWAGNRWGRSGECNHEGVTAQLTQKRRLTPLSNGRWEKSYQEGIGKVGKNEKGGKPKRPGVGGGKTKLGYDQGTLGDMYREERMRWCGGRVSTTNPPVSCLTSCELNAKNRKLGRMTGKPGGWWGGSVVQSRGGMEQQVEYKG